MIFKSSIDNSEIIFFNGIVPDSCDINILNKIVDFRKDSLRFPTYTWTNDRLNSLSKDCLDKTDSISLLCFGADSADLFVIKNYMDKENKMYSMRKYYRIRFSSDTLKNITPHLKTSKDKY